MIAAIREAMKPNWIDRAVGYLAPVVGARRTQARAAMALSGYIGARWDRRATKEWYVPSNAADGDILPDSQTLRDRPGAKAHSESRPLRGGSLRESGFKPDLPSPALPRKTHSRGAFMRWRGSVDIF